MEAGPSDYLVHANQVGHCWPHFPNIGGKGFSIFHIFLTLKEAIYPIYPIQSMPSWSNSISPLYLSVILRSHQFYHLPTLRAICSHQLTLKLQVLGMKPEHPRDNLAFHKEKVGTWGSDLKPGHLSCEEAAMPI